tara:strand:- start:452 stop:790 length:339 start_codon:yes stop_codon:yes gene_type:complete
MFKLKIFISIIIFSFLLIGTSSIKNKTRELEKKINILTIAHANKERTLSEVQLDYHYLTSPSMIEMKIEHLGLKKYLHMEHSKIFLSMENFINIQNKQAMQKTLDEKKIQKK